MGHTHYKVNPNGTTTLFTPDNCETCGAVIQAANTVGGVAEDIPSYKKFGMIEWTDALPEEGYYSEEMEQEACYNCNK